MEYCVAVKRIDIKSGDSSWSERDGDQKDYLSANTECDVEGLTIGAYTVKNCMNTTAE